MESDKLGQLQAGDEIDVDDSRLLDDGVVRLHCEAGWLTLKPDLVTKVMEPSVAIGGMSAIAELNSQLAKEIGGDAVEERVFTVTMNKATCELRVGGMNLTVMKGPDFGASYQYTELANWEYQTKDGADRSLTLVKDDKSKVVFKTAEAREIADLMTAHATVVA